MRAPTNLEKHLAVAVKIDESLRLAATPEALTVPGIEIDGDAVLPGPGWSRLIEDLWLARRTYSTIHFLMLHTARSNSSAGDFTEDAGVLMRRVLELLAQVVWLTDIEPPPGLALPAPLGSPDHLLADVTDARWASDEDRQAIVAYLCAAVDWIDIQALRADRAELAQRSRTAERFSRSEPDPVRQAQHANGLAVLETLDELTTKRLTDIGAPTAPRASTTDLLARLGGAVETMWRYESDVAHGMAMGRLHQRGTGTEPMFGAPSPQWRRELVISAANGAMLELGGRVLRALDADPSSLEQASSEYRTIVATSDFD